MREWIVSEEELGVDGAYYSGKELVRCKDCKHHHDSFGEEYCHRSYTPMPVSAEWFCPKGERKEDPT